MKDDESADNLEENHCEDDDVYEKDDFYTDADGHNDQVAGQFAECDVDDGACEIR